MNKQQKVDNLIKNGGYVESDRAFLMSLDEAHLDRLTAVQNANASALKTAVENARAEAAKKTDNSETNNGGGKMTPEEEAKKKKKEAAKNEDSVETVESFLAKAPAGIRSVLNAAIERDNARKTELIDAITANEDSGFTKEELQAFELPMLERLAKLASRPTANEDVAPDYSGNAPVVNSAPKGGAATKNSVPEPLPLPKMEFTSAK